MPTSELAQVILALGTLVTAIGTIVTAVISMRGNRRIEETSRAATASRLALHNDTAAKVEQVHQLTNSMSTKVQEAIADKERLLGIEEGRARSAAERGAAALARETQPVAPPPVVIAAPAPVALPSVPNGKT